MLMKNKVFVYILFLLAGICPLFGQSDSAGSSKYEFMPSGLHFLPLKGNNQEAKIGVLYYPEDANLKLDIGNSIDLVKLNFDSFNSRLTFGIDFMAYAYSTSFKGNRLQIDALDGLFGGNACFSKDFSGNKFFTRFRIIHNSAHFADGHYDISTKSWIGNQSPIPFTRDFGELLFAYEWIKTNSSTKIYGGPAYSTLVRPSVLKKYSFSGGFEYAFINAFGKILNKDSNVFLTYYFNLAGTPVYQGNNNILLGMKFGNWYGKGFVLYTNYYSGNNVFSEYYKDRIKKFGIGFLVDFE